MANNFGFDNAIGWAHLQLRGGWKNIAMTTGCYALAIVVLIIVTLQLQPLATTRILAGWTSGLLAFEAALLVLLGCNTIATSLKIDLAAILESHRLMPISPPAAIVGYLAGPTTQALSLAAVTFLIGTVTALGGQVPLRHWFIPHLTLALFTLFAWTLVIFAAFAHKHGVRVIWLFLIFGGVIARGGLWSTLPGLNVLASPMIGHSIFALRADSTEITWPLLAAFTAQLYIGTICFLGATRRYRQSDIPALSPLLALLLLAGWVLISVLGIRYESDFVSDLWRNFGTTDSVQFLSSFIVATLLAIVPVASAAWSHTQWCQHRDIHDPALPRRAFPPLLVVLLATAIVLVLTAAAPEPRHSWTQACVRTAIATACFLLPISYLLQIIHRRRARPLLLVGLWVLLTCLGPFILDAIRYGMSNDPHAELMSALATCSPLGALITIWDGDPLQTTPGLIFQASLALLTLILYHARPPRPTP